MSSSSRAQVGIPPTTHRHILLGMLPETPSGCYIRYPCPALCWHGTNESITAAVYSPSHRVQGMNPFVRGIVSESGSNVHIRQMQHIHGKSFWLLDLSSDLCSSIGGSMHTETRAAVDGLPLPCSSCQWRAA